LAAVERCPQCGRRRSRKLEHKRVSFWKLPLADRKRLAAALYEAISSEMDDEQTAVRLFIEMRLPYFREYRSFYRLLRLSRITDGDRRIDHQWYLEKPDRRINPFTGLLWPRRE
jgi:hypothetical protein